jgi:multiple sugar transport system permease protein
MTEINKAENQIRRPLVRHGGGTNKRIAKQSGIYILLTAVGVILIFPWVFMVSRSLMNVNDIMSLPVKFFPAKGTFDAYVKLFSQNNYLRYTLNTFSIMAFNIITVPLSASLCAYGFAKIRYRGSKIVFALTLATIMIPGTVTQIPLFVIFARLGWLESNLPLVIPAMFGGGAINIFLLVQFMRGIPKELEDAARVDGAGVFRRFAQITVPLCTPILLYIVVGVFGSVWSDFYGPLVYLKSPEQYTLAIAIYYDSINTNAAMEAANIRMAAGTFMTLLPALLFLIYQRKLVDGIMVGAIKG